MKKGLLIILTLICVLALLLTACESGVDYTKPTVTVEGTTIKFSHGVATSFQYKLDDGNWQQGGSVALSEEVGQHSVTVKVDSENAKSAEEITFTYETKAVSLSEISVENAVASWTPVAKTVSLKIGEGEYSAVSANTYTATETVTISVKAEGGYDLAGKVYYVGEAVKTATITVGGAVTEPTKLATPTVVVNADNSGLQWADVANATKYQVKVNDGEYADATSHAFLTTAGTYTIKVKAVADGENFTDSDEATFVYQTKAVVLSDIIVEGNVANWTATAKVVSLKKGSGEYQEVTEFSVSAKDTLEISVKAEGGWDDANKILYVGEAVKTATITVTREAERLIEDAEKDSDADLSDVWEIKKYDNNGWVDTSASIKLTPSYPENGTAISLNCWNNTVAFRYTHEYELDGRFNAISFDVKGDGEATLKIQLMKKGGIYLTYTVGKISNSWEHVVILMSDTGWRVNFSGQDISVSDAIASDKVPEIEIPDDIIAYTDMFNILLQGNVSGGPSTAILMDNIKFVNTTDSESSSSQMLFNLASVYTAENLDVVMALKLTSATDAVFESLNLEENDSYELSYEIAGNQIVLKDLESNGAAITVTGVFGGNGNSILITDVQGEYTEDFSELIGDITFESVKNVDNFNDYGETGVGIDASNTNPSSVSGLRKEYFVEYYSGNSSDSSPLSGANWKLVSAEKNIQLTDGMGEGNAIQVRAFDGGNARYITMGVVAGIISQNSVANWATPIGSGTTLSLWAKGSASGDVTLRIAPIYKANPTGEDIRNNLVYQDITVGKDSDWTHFEISLDGTKTLYGICIVAKATWAGDRVVAIDNIEVYSASPYATYIAPVHECQHVCDICGKCLDESCENDACVDKCAGHELADLNVNENFDSLSAVPATVSSSSGSNIYFKNDNNGAEGSKCYLSINYKNNSWVRFTPTEAGKAKHVSLYLKNTFSSAAEVTLALSIHGTDGAMIGSAQEVVLSAGQAWTKIEFYLPIQVTLKYIQIERTSTAPGTDNYFYVDSIVIDNAEEPTPVHECQHICETCGKCTDAECADEACAEKCQGHEPSKANLTLDFEDGTTGIQYTNSAWTQEVYNSSWDATSGKMNCREKDGSKVVNFAVGYSMSYRFTYNSGTPIGLTNKISLKVGNYFDGAEDILVKLILVDSDGNQNYVIGSSSEFKTISATSGMASMALHLDEVVDVECFVLVVRSNKSDNAYLYVDDISFSCVDYVLWEGSNEAGYNFELNVCEADGHIKMVVKSGDSVIANLDGTFALDGATVTMTIGDGEVVYVGTIGNAEGTLINYSEVSGSNATYVVAITGVNFTKSEGGSL